MADFVVTERVRFKIDETIGARRVGDVIVGFDKVAVDGTRTPIPGYMTGYKPLDPCAKMPLTVDGVQLWYGWTVR